MADQNRPAACSWYSRPSTPIDDFGTFVPADSQGIRTIFDDVIDDPVDVSGFLISHRTSAVAAARESIGRSHLDHYGAAGDDALDRRLEALFGVLTTCCAEHHLDDALAYAADLANERQAGGYPLLEVQTVINVLEESVWRSVMADLPAEQQGQALALVSTVLGAVKDAVARSYLARSGSRPLPVRVESLFSGSEGTAGDI